MYELCVTILASLKWPSLAKCGEISRLTIPDDHE